MRLFILLLVATLAGCATRPDLQLEKPTGETVLTEAQRYFIEIALRSEFDDVTPKKRASAFAVGDEIDGGKAPVLLQKVYEITDRKRLERRRIVRRWERPVLLYIEGVKDPVLIQEAYDVIRELKALAPQLDIQWVNRREKANFLIYFGPYLEFSARYAPHSRVRLKKNWGFFSVRWRKGGGGISQAKMYVDTDRTRDQVQRKHLLREELTQAFGLFADSKRYPSSIFYQHWSTTTDYSELDRALIKLLYDERLHSGMDEQAVRAVWRGAAPAQQTLQMKGKVSTSQALGLER